MRNSLSLTPEISSSRPMKVKPEITMQRPWQELILTDHAEFELHPSVRAQTLLVCYDAESAAQLRARQHVVREPQEYFIPQYSTLDELYEDYQRDFFDSESKSDTTGFAEYAWMQRHLQFKGVETWAPILYLWDMTTNILSQECFGRIQIDVRDAWLEIVLQSLLIKLA